MDFTGLVHYFPVHRALTEQEREYQLKQSRRLDVEPKYQLCVIKMNSTFLESVDKWFAWKGLISAFSLTILIMFTVPCGYMIVNSLLSVAGFVATDLDHTELLTFATGMAFGLGIVWWLMIKLLSKEAFAYTHYPIRFNRKNRKVYYFRPNGSIGVIPWDEVFFTLGYSAAQWEVRGHVLAVDGTTVIDTFALSYSGMLIGQDLDPRAEPSPNDFVRAHWEFIRRYMEEGPAEVSQPVQFCMPVDGRKETLKGGAQRIFANFAGSSGFFMLVAAPLCIWFILGRVFAMWTSRVPAWPKEIETECRIEANDLYAIAGDSAGDRIAVQQ